MKTNLLIILYLLLFTYISSILCKQVYAKDSFILDQIIPIESNNATIFKSYKGYNAKLNTYLDIQVIDIDLNRTKLNIKPVVSENRPGYGRPPERVTNADKYPRKHHRLRTKSPEDAPEHDHYPDQVQGGDQLYLLHRNQTHKRPCY